MSATLRLLAVITHSPLWLAEPVCEFDRKRPTWHSGVDTHWYGRNYAGDLSHPADSELCLAHYLAHASRGSVSPSLVFDEHWYRIRYPEVADEINDGEFENGWKHYLMLGCRQGRSPVWWFNENWYSSRHPDVGEGIRNRALLCAFEHYLLYGIRQNFAPSIYFDPHWYRNAYQTGEGKASREIPIVDYLLSTDRGSKNPAPFFDAAWYSRQYLSATPVVADGERAHIRSPLEHYVYCGIPREYSPSPNFDERAYRKMNPSVTDSIRSGKYYSGFEHYAQEGLLAGAPAPSHMNTGALDYARPEFLRLYERSLRLNLRQAYLLRQLT